ncbi:DEAD/DEAH box helicase [Pullulanibacillus sp. KACC 23026]|uniref:DEAD/DEAH box helicase n=1 Tax=Pullulanibacillus sp. KACC 23026 TaxID=3028315 RepID=UPI0023AF50B3|nr:DEAD/DEAH box helicase [Pullulanibacillus sp. KACC 23026]WEG11138.1 DEAD/DEAH box helicase [Pullulanibacillus sp. KACC 23026]
MIDQLTKDEIKELFTNTVYRRGRSYYRDGRVRDLYYDADKKTWQAKVRGSKSYKVTIEDDELGLSTECDCPAYDQYWGPCKHIAAVLLNIHDLLEKQWTQRPTHAISFAGLQERQLSQHEELERRQKEVKRLQEEQQARQMKQLTHQFILSLEHGLQNRKDQKMGEKRSPLLVDWVLKLEKSYSYYSPKWYLSVEMKVGEKRTYVVRDLKDFLKAVQEKRPYTFTKLFTYDPVTQAFNQEDQEVVELLLEAMSLEETYKQFQNGYSSSSAPSNQRALTIPPIFADRLLLKLQKTLIYFEMGRETYTQIELCQEEWPITLELDKGPLEGYQLDLTSLQPFTYLDLYGYIILKNQFYRLSEEQQHLFRELKKLMDHSQRPVIPIANDQIEAFLAFVVPKVKDIASLELTHQVSTELVTDPLESQLFVDLADEKLLVSLEFHYGSNVLNPFESHSLDQDGSIIMREAEKERDILHLIERTSYKSEGGRLCIEGEEDIFDFLYEKLPLLEDKAEIFLTQTVKSLILPDYPRTTTTIDVDASINWLNVSFNIEGIEKESLKELLQAVVEKKKYYRLPSGAFMSLESEEFETIQKLFHEFKKKPSQIKEDGFQLPIYRGLELDELVHQESRTHAKYGKAFRRFLKQLKHPEDLEFEVPKSLKAELRDYQNDGFQWLKTLKVYRLGGILADDMGLGKTLQSIAFLLSEKENNKDIAPALIVAPASLVYNWRNECQKFAPSLSIEVMIGNPQERLDKLQSGNVPDVWITSYPTLRQDIEFYQQLPFSTLILDEAQAIKNHTTKTAKAVREIHAGTRFALSGTPIENSIDELWSIFQTIMPDFFPNQKAFRELERDKVARMIRPFLLRRLKKDVLTELPDKIETVHYSELTNQQKKLYLAYLEKLQKESKQSLQEEGFQKNRIKILAGLTRLRQLCCHPSLFIDNYRGDSGKLQQLKDLVQNALENGRRLLIFSQFTSMLTIISDQLREDGLPFFYLDGQTPPKDRVEMVDQFNQGEADLFLISLKAGNTGLNLTGADTVILFDLWWNPAVEEQAAGRAHRIGQKNVVQVIRLITQGTIEEKIYELQQTKRELIESVVQPGEQALSSLTEQEIRDLLNI